MLLQMVSKSFLVISGILSLTSIVAPVVTNDILALDRVFAIAIKETGKGTHKPFTDALIGNGILSLRWFSVRLKTTIERLAEQRHGMQGTRIEENRQVSLTFADRCAQTRSHPHPASRRTR